MLFGVTRCLTEEADPGRPAPRQRCQLSRRELNPQGEAEEEEVAKEGDNRERRDVCRGAGALQGAEEEEEGGVVEGRLFIHS